MKNNILKRLLSFILSFIILANLLPVAELKAFASENDKVYISISYDGEYQNGIHYKPVSLSDISQINLDEYGLGDYNYDSDGDGDYETTVLHLYVYIHTQVLGLEWSDVSCSGGAGSIFFERGLFGFPDCNLNYYVNGEYPLLYEGWGATADMCVLNNGDFVDVAGFTSWSFWFDSNAGFKYFTGGAGDIEHSFSAKANEAFTVTLCKTMQDMATGSGTLLIPHSADVYYSKTLFDNSNCVTTDENGNAEITFTEEGTWYLWSYGEYGFEDSGSVVNAPAYATVYVEGAAQPTPAPNNAPVLTENFAAGTGTATVTLGEEYSINLAEVFADADGDALTYYCNDTKLTETVYKTVPKEAGSQVLVFKAYDGKDYSGSYTVTLTVNEPVKETAKLASLVLYRQADKKTKPLVGAEGKDKFLPFNPETTEYIITQDLRKIEDRNNNKLWFCAVPENENYSVTLYYPGNEEGVDIKSTADVFKDYSFITAGKNDFKIVVSSDDGTVEDTTYSFTVYAIPTLAQTTTVESIYPVYLTKDLSVNTKTAEITVPTSLKEITVNVNPKSEECTVTYNGQTSNTVNIENTDEIVIVVEEDGMSETYTYKLKKVAENFVTINTTPEDAKVEVTYSNGKYVLSKTAEALDGRYPLVFTSKTKKFTYTVTKEGYTPVTGEITSTDEVIDVTLTKEIPPQPEEVTDVDWKNFRNSDVNMAITSAKTPTGKISLKWNRNFQGANGWSNSSNVPIIVDNNIVTMAGSTLYMLDAETGEIVKQAEMYSVPNFGYTPITYANGMIFCPLSNGTVQAFNATTLESLWVYRDNLGGQSLSPIAYSDGYIYTGFWNGENGDANFVCIDVTDYDAENKTEPKTAVWSHKHNGGFYWAGAVVVGDAVIVGSDDGDAEGSNAGSCLYSFNKKTGEIITKLALAADAGDQRSSIAYDEENGKVYFTTKGGYLYTATVNSDGTVTDLKGVKYDAQITSTPVVYKGRVYFGIGSGIRTDGSEGYFVAADADTLERKLSVELKGYPQGSPLLSTAYETDGYLYFYLTYNDLPGGISMIKVKTDAQSDADIQLTEIYEAEGFSQFCIASIICDENGTLYYKNDTANIFAVTAATSRTVIELIDKIGTVTLESEPVIKAAREAYDTLDESEKSKVTNYDVLIAAEKELENFVKADAVDKLISDIGYATINNSKRIKEAREEYEKLTDYQKSLIKNYEKLVALEKEYKELAEEAAGKVEKLIDKIGKVEIDSAEDISAARLAYNQLAEELQKLVENYDKLTKAEAELEKIRREALALLANGKLVLSKTELLQLKDDFEEITEETRYDDALELLKTFYKLGERQQLALENSDAVKQAQNIVAKENHNNRSTGIRVEGLEWNIRLIVEKADDEETEDSIKTKLENCDVLTMWDIYLEDVLTSEKHTLKDAVVIKIPVNLIGDYTAYDYLKVLHYTDDGRIELLNCTVEDGHIIFNAGDFSWYGVVGFMNEEDLSSDTVTTSPQVDVTNGNNTVVWAAVASVGLAALFVLYSMKKRINDED